MSSTIETSALGGSASSQAENLQRSAWTPRRRTAIAIEALVFGLPIVVAVVVVRLVVVAVAAPSDRFQFWAWMAALVAVSCLATFATQRLLVRLAPLTMLLKMSLVFPDQAPSRFGLALRTGTLRSLARRVKGPDVAQSAEQLWAEQLLTAMTRLNRHDRLTTGHSERVRAYAVMLGEEIGLPREELDRLNWAALIHDIGKLEVPTEILNKPGRPTNDEWIVLRAHPGAGWRYVEPLRPWLGGWVDAATQHHERWDGGGYPRGLSGADISLAGRIVSIADAFDVMTAARSYKQPLGAAQARTELTRNSGTQFDPALVRSFLQISLGRMRRLIGPLGVLAHFPDLIRVPLTAALTSTTAVVTAAAVAAGALTGAAAPRVIEPAAPQMESIGSLPSGAEPTELPIPGGVEADSAEVPTVQPGDVAPAVVPAPAGVPQAPSAPAPAAPQPPSAPAPAPTAPPTTAPPTTAPPTTAPPTTAPPTTAPPPTAPPSTAAPGVQSNAVLVIDDVGTTKAGIKLNIHVLQNDDFRGGAADLTTLVVLVEPVHGTVKVAGENLLYEPASGFTGTDTMTYSVCSLVGACGSATVTVTVG